MKIKATVEIVCFDKTCKVECPFLYRSETREIWCRLFGRRILYQAKSFPEPLRCSECLNAELEGGK